MGWLLCRLQQKYITMILSMTGFGRAEHLVAGKKISAEIKSLNSKQLDISMRLPQVYRTIELDLRSQVAQALVHGKIDLTILVEVVETVTDVHLNIPLLQTYKEQIIEMADALSLPLPQDWYSTLLRLPDAVKTDTNATATEEEEIKTIYDTVAEATSALTDFRKQEGARLEAFFSQKIERIGQLLSQVEQYEPERTAKIKARIQDSLSKIDAGDYDQNRFEQEMIFYIEKLDITEEKVRLRNHLDYFLATMNTGSAQGKKLGFIAQEMGREINTLGSKSNHAEMQNLVVRMKDELEQIKEQVLNVL